MVNLKKRERPRVSVSTSGIAVTIYYPTEQIQTGEMQIDITQYPFSDAWKRFSDEVENTLSNPTVRSSLGFGLDESARKSFNDMIKSQRAKNYQDPKQMKKSEQPMLGDTIHTDSYGDVRVDIFFRSKGEAEYNDFRQIEETDTYRVYENDNKAIGVSWKSEGHPND